MGPFGWLIKFLRWLFGQKLSELIKETLARIRERVETLLKNPEIRRSAIYFLGIGLGIQERRQPKNRLAAKVLATLIPSLLPEDLAQAFRKGLRDGRRAGH